MQFQDFIEHTLQLEGGYVNDPVDPGGETKYGISKRSYPNVDIAALTPDQAVDIYRNDYWEAPRINELPASVAYAVFDMGVNAGPGRAIKILQRILGIKQDGRIGPVTIQAAQDYQGNLLADYSEARRHYYNSLVQRNQFLSKFKFGWLRRVNQVEQKLHSFVVTDSKPDPEQGVG